MNTLKSIVFCVCFCFSLLAGAGQININTADATTLTKEMEGIGITRAEAIVAYRDKNGPFASIDDLTKVDGIGNRTVEKNRPKIVLK